MSPHDDKADRERRRKNEADRAPEPRPKYRGDDKRYRGYAGARAIEPGLHDVVAQKFEQNEKADCQQRHHPARRDGQREGDRYRSRDPRSEVGNESEHRRTGAPQHSIGHADEVKANRHGDAVAHIHHELHKQVAKDARPGIIHRLRG